MLNVTKIVTQTDRSLAIETSLGPDVFVLRSLRYESRLSQLFDLRLSVSPQHGLVRPEPLIGSEVRVRVSDHLGEARYFRGLVSEVSQKPHRDDATEFELAVVPRLWLLGRHLDHRIFQNLTVREIVKSYFTRYGVVIDDRCTDTYEPLEYCVQYGETDLAFVSRLLEHFGISYHFEHSDEKHVMVLTDGPAFFRALEGTPVIRFARDRTPVEPVSIRDWRSTTQLETGRVVVDDFDFKKPLTNLMSDAEVEVKYSVEAAARFEYPGLYNAVRTGERIARLRAEELASHSKQYVGESNLRTPRSGFTFELFDAAGALDPVYAMKYLITGVRLEATSDPLSQKQGEEGGVATRCEIWAIEADRVIRPRRISHKPRVAGPQSAIVTGPSGQEIYTDQFGRVKVKFHWDRHGPDDGASSCWLRCSQPWAGKKWGGIQIPRIGQEVIVDFLEGDPDQPIITGRVYNAESMPPVSGAGRDATKGETNPKDMMEAAMQMSMRSNSLGGSGGHNEITMHDAGGAEKLYIRAQKDEVHLVQNDRSDTVQNDERRFVGNNRDKHIVNNETVNVDNNRTETVGVNETITIGVNRSLSVGVNQTTSIGAAESHSVGSTRTKLIAIAENQSIGVTQSSQIGLARIDVVGVGAVEMVGLKRVALIGGTESVTTGQSASFTCGTDFVVSASGNAGIKAAKMIVIDCPDITLKAAGGFIRINASGVTIQGAKIKLNSGGSAGSLSDDAAPAAAGSSSSSGSSAGSGGAGGAGGVGGPGGGGPLGSLSGIMQEIPTSALPNGVGDVFGSLASGQLPSLNSVLGMIPPGILPPKLQAALSAGQQALGALQSKVGAPTDSSGPEGASVSSLVDPSTSNDVDEDGRAVQPLAGIDTSTPDAFSKQAPDPDRRDAFIRKAIDATGGDLTASDDYLQKLRNASNGQMRYDKDLVAAQHYMKGASGANTLGSGVQDALSSVYEGIKHIPGGNYILSDPITQPPPSPPDSYVLQSAHKGSAAAGKSGVEGVRDDVKRKPKR